MKRYGMIACTRVLAFVSGLIVGGFLFRSFGWDSNTAFSSWGWYLLAVLLAGIGLSGIFRAQWLIAGFGAALGPVVYETAVLGQRLARDSTCCNLWPVSLVMVLSFSFPAPFLGGMIGALLMRWNQLPRPIIACALVAGLAIGALLPHFQEAQLHQLETQTVPQLLRQIHDAEMAYSASQPDGAFACDGRKLPSPAGKLAWNSALPPGSKAYFIVGEYSVSLECRNDVQPRGFQLRAVPSYASVRANRLSMDQSGVLVVVPVR